MPENKLTKEDLEALKQCQTKEDIEKYLSGRQFSEDELNNVAGGSLPEGLASNDFITRTGRTCVVVPRSGFPVADDDSEKIVKTRTDKLYKK